MIAVALSGGVDSAAAAICLHEQGLPLMGVTLQLGKDTPSQEHLERASRLCKIIGIDHKVIDIEDEFRAITSYFCNEYLVGNTPNPCALCNRDIKFGLLFDRVKTFGAVKLATGHYVKKVSFQDRHFLTRARDKNSQEYFLGLLSQEALGRSVFPLYDITKDQARALVKKSGITIPEHESSQDVCFIKDQDHVSFICSSTQSQTTQGPILDVKGKVIGKHHGALHYTIGQRKGLGMGFGRKVYVLAKDMKKNSITIGDLNQWPYKGFIIKDYNFMKISSVTSPRDVFVKVRYKQKAEHAVIKPTESGDILVEYTGIFAPGQLAVVYDNEDAILCAGIIHAPLGER